MPTGRDMSTVPSGTEHLDQLEVFIAPCLKDEREANEDDVHVGTSIFISE